MIVVSLLLILVAMVLLGSGLVSGSNPLLVGAIAASLLAAIALVIGARQSAPAQLGLPWPRRARRAGTTATVTPGAAAAATGDAPTPRAGAAARAPVSPAAPPVSPGPVSPAGGTVTASAPAATVGGPPATRAPAASGGTAAGAAAATGTSDAGVPPAPADPAPAGDREYVADRGYAPAAADTGRVDTAYAADPGSAAGPRSAAGRGPATGTRVPAQGGNGRYDQPPEDADDIPPDEPAAQVVSAADAARVAALSDPVRVIDGRPRYHVPECVHLLGRESEALPVGEAISLGFTPCGLCEPDLVLLDRARQG